MLRPLGEVIQRSTGSAAPGTPEAILTNGIKVGME